MKTNLFTISIGVLIDYAEFEVSEGGFIRGNYSNTNKILEFAEHVKTQVKEQKIYGGKKEVSMIVTTLKFEYFTIDLLKTLPKDIGFFTIEKNDKSEILFKRVTPYTDDFFNKCIANEKKTINKRKELEMLRKAYKPTSNNVDYEAAIMNALKKWRSRLIWF